MKLFDHSKPANRSEWVFAFVEAYRALRPEIGTRYAEVHARQAYHQLAALPPAAAARAWQKRKPSRARSPLL